MDWPEKGARISTAVASMTTRTLTSIATERIDTTTLILDKTRWINPTYWFDKLLGINRFDETINSAYNATESVDNYFDEALSHDNIYNTISNW